MRTRPQHTYPLTSIDRKWRMPSSRERKRNPSHFSSRKVSQLIPGQSKKLTRAFSPLRVPLVLNNAPWAKTVLLQDLLMNNAYFHVALFESSSIVVMARNLACVRPKIVQNSNYQCQSGWYERKDPHRPANHKPAGWERSQLLKRISSKGKQDTCTFHIFLRCCPFLVAPEEGLKDKLQKKYWVAVGSFIRKDILLAILGGMARNSALGRSLRRM